MATPRADDVPLDGPTVRLPDRAPGGSSGTFVTERRCTLTLLSGEQAGRSVEVKRTPFVVGKGEECDLVVADPTVSRTHLRIDVDNGAFIVRDLGSTNGTFVDQFRVREAWLRPGVVIRAGSAELRFDPSFAPVDVAPSTEERFGHLVGRSTRMRQLFSLLGRVAPSDATIVILGETGTGKSAVARAIHDASRRKAGPFVTIDCGAIAENLIESELFGHEKGAFTGADKPRVGAIERAQGGTLFIDELVDLRLDLQPRLLRVLEERELKRVGGNEAIKLDVRVIAASRFDLQAEVRERRFREDLYFRLAVFTVALPALRERVEDVAGLAAAFARATPGGEKVLARLQGEVLARLEGYAFPGNVRELRNLVERASLLDGDPTDGIAATPPRPAPPASPVDAPLNTADELVVTTDRRLPFKEAKELLLERFEVAYVRQLLERYHGNVSALARGAGIDRKYLYTLVKKHGLSLPERDE